MRVVTHTKLIERNRQISTYLFFLTFVLLIGGFLLVNFVLFDPNSDIPEPVTLLLQVAILPIFFGLTIFSVRMTNLWIRQPRPETVITEGLKGLSNKSVLYHYYHFPSRHVLICPQGVFSIVTRWHDGHFTVKGDKWTTHRSNPLSRILSFIRFDGVGNPTYDAQAAAKRLQNTLDKIAPNVKVQPLILFVDPRAKLTISEPIIPVLFANAKQEPNLKDYLRDLKNTDDSDAGDTSKKKSSSRATMPLTEDEIRTFETATLSKS